MFRVPSALGDTDKPPVRLCWELDGGRGGVGPAAEEPFRRVTGVWSIIGRRRKKEKIRSQLLDCENGLLHGHRNSNESRNSARGWVFWVEHAGMRGRGEPNGRKECPYPTYAAAKRKGSLGYPATTARCRQSMRRVIKSQVGPLESCACQLARTTYHETFRVPYVA